MATHLATDVRNDAVQGLITRAGAGAKIKFYSGTRPAGLAAVGGGTTLNGTVTMGATIGTATGGSLDWDEAGATQTASAHVTGTPTFVDITTSADVVKMRTDLGAGGWTFAGGIVNGQNITLSNLVAAAGNV